MFADTTFRSHLEHLWYKNWQAFDPESGKLMTPQTPTQLPQPHQPPDLYKNAPQCTAPYATLNPIWEVRGSAGPARLHDCFTQLSPLRLRGRISPPVLGTPSPPLSPPHGCRSLKDSPEAPPAFKKETPRASMSLRAWRLLRELR